MAEDPKLPEETEPLANGVGSDDREHGCGSSPDRSIGDHKQSERSRRGRGREYRSRDTEESNWWKGSKESEKERGRNAELDRERIRERERERERVSSRRSRIQSEMGHHDEKRDGLRESSKGREFRAPEGESRERERGSSSSLEAEDKVRELLASDSMDFSSWTSLIMEIEETSADDIGTISRVYEPFLSEFPLCYGYWEKYANHMARLCSIDKVIDVYEGAVRAATYSVDVWVNYCSFAMLFFEDLDDVRRLYERGLTFIGKDYLCCCLWDKCMAFEHSHKQWNHLVHIFIRSLKFPTKKLHSYYQSFKKLVSVCEEEIKCQNTVFEPPEAEVASELVELSTHGDSEITSLISDLLDQPFGMLRPKTIQKFLTIGEYFYQKSTDMDVKISYFESQLRRPYFHVKPLNDHQLQIWHHYLDFVEKQGDFDWTVKLYERCLVPCANYPEFWVRYIEFMETRGGREIANLALARALKTFLKRNPEFFHYCAKVKEQLGDAHGARPSLLNCDMGFSSDFINRVNQQANLEKRLGNIDAAYLIYEKAIDMVQELDMKTFSVLYMHFARLTYVVTGDLDAAKDVFFKGIARAPNCKSLYEGLLSFMATHGASRQVGALDSFVDHAIVSELGASLVLNLRDRQDISNLFLEFVDLCGTIHDIRKAWARHMRLFRPIMEPGNSNHYSINATDVLEKTNGISSVRGNEYGEGGLDDSDDHLLLEYVQSSKQKIDHPLDGPALATKSHSEVASSSTIGNLEQAQMSEDARKLSEQQAIELPVYIGRLPCEVQTFSPNLEGPSGCHEAEHQSQPLLGSETLDDLKPSLENLCISHPDNETQHSNPTTYDDNANPSPSDETKHNCDHSVVEAAQQSNHRRIQSSMTTTVARVDNSFKSTKTEAELQQAEVDNVVQDQQSAQAPTTALYPQYSVNWHQVHYDGQVPEHQSRFHSHVQTQQQQQWQVPVQPQQTRPGVTSQVRMGQAYVCQSQQANIQMVNQLQGRYQVVGTQVYPSATVAWPMLNVQQNSVDGGQPQFVGQMVTQPHAYQHSLQSNEQHGYFLGGHGASHQFWHYHQQQLYHMQDQQQHNTQLEHYYQQNQLQQPQKSFQQQQPQNQLQMNHLHQQQQRQMQEQQLNQPQHPQSQYCSQPSQPIRPEESLPQQDLQQAQQEQREKYVQQPPDHLPQIIQ